MALNVGNLVATLSLDKKGFDTGIQDAAKKTEGFAGGFSDKLSSLSPRSPPWGRRSKGPPRGLRLNSPRSHPRSPRSATSSKALRPGYLRGSPHSQPPIGAAKDKLIGLATGFASKMKTLAVPIAAVGAAIASLGTAAVLAADNINKAYNAIRVWDGCDRGGSGKPSNLILTRCSAQSPAGAGEVGTAIADLNTRLGLTGKPLQNMATRFLELSRIHWD